MRWKVTRQWFGQLYSSEIEGKWELENRNKLSNTLTMYIWKYILDWNLDQTRNIEYIKLKIYQTLHLKLNINKTLHITLKIYKTLHIKLKICKTCVMFVDL
jgi:hypothetical protein